MIMTKNLPSSITVKAELSQELEEGLTQIIRRYLPESKVPAVIQDSVDGGVPEQDLPLQDEGLRQELADLRQTVEKQAKQLKDLDKFLADHLSREIETAKQLRLLEQQVKDLEEQQQQSPETDGPQEQLQLLFEAGELDSDTGSARPEGRAGIETDETDGPQEQLQELTEELDSDTGNPRTEGRAGALKLDEEPQDGAGVVIDLDDLDSDTGDAAVVLDLDDLDEEEDNAGVVLDLDDLDEEKPQQNTPPLDDSNPRKAQGQSPEQLRKLFLEAQDARDLDEELTEEQRALLKNAGESLLSPAEEDAKWERKEQERLAQEKQKKSKRQLELVA
jgi:uncharacterized coiled-coil protein SlyX